jgi:hypothetical protein
MFNYNGSIQELKVATLFANEINLINVICAKIQMNGEFDMCDCYPEHLGEKFKNFVINRDIEIEVYYPKWRWSKAYGYFTKSKPLTIHVNGYKVRHMTRDRLVSLFYHEAGHMVDNYYTECDCNHGDNSPVGKENTFQYSLNRFVREYYGITDKPKRKVYVPWWRRIFKWIF